MDFEGVSPEVLRDLRDWEVRRRRTIAIQWFVVLTAAVAVWIVVDRQPGRTGFFLLGILVWSTLQAAWAWRRERRHSSVSAAGTSPDDEQELAARLRERLAVRPSFVTYAIAGVLIGISVIAWQTAGSIGREVAAAGLVKPLVPAGEWWRLITATFLHANFPHLWANLAALVVFGRLVEACGSRAMLLWTYMVSALGASLASFWFSPATSSIGASGAIMGLVGFIAVFGWGSHDRLPDSVRQVARMALFATGFVGAFAFGLVDNAAHAGGALTGAAVALLAAPRAMLHGRPGFWRPLAAAVSAVAFVAGAGWTGLMLARLPPETPRDQEAALNRRMPRGVVTVGSRLIRDASGTDVEISNRSDRTLEAYEVVVMTFAGPLRLIWRDDCCFAWTGHDPVAPGASVRVPLHLAPRTSNLARRVVVTAAAFDDGSMNGESSRRAMIVWRRRQALAEADFWIDKLERIRGLPGPVAFRRIAAFADVRAMLGEPGASAIPALGMSRFLEQDPESPAIADEVEAARARIVVARNALVARLDAASESR